MFRWYSPNKDWLENPRLGRMMKRLLRRAAALNSPPDGDDSQGGDPDSPAANSGAAAAVLEARFHHIVDQLNQTQAQVKQLELGAAKDTG